MSTFKFEMLGIVKIIVSGETGVIVGRAEYSDSAPGYLIRYKRGDGAATEAWWPESALAGEVLE